MVPRIFRGRGIDSASCSRPLWTLLNPLEPFMDSNKRLFKEPFPSTRQIADTLKVSHRTVNRWEARGLLPQPVIREGHIKRWNAEDLNAAFGPRGKGAT